MSTATALETIDTPAAPQSHKDKYAKLTRSDVGVLLKLRKDGLTQAEIAQRLGCSQGTVAKWLQQFTDTTEPAKEFLRGNALRMAQNIVRKGLARDHVQTLKGLNVLENEGGGGVVVQIGISTSQGTRLSPPVVIEAGESLSNR
jgi:DNA-binding transcriptional regulator YiaG